MISTNRAVCWRRRGEEERLFPADLLLRSRRTRRLLIEINTRTSSCSVKRQVGTREQQALAPSTYIPSAPRLKITMFASGPGFYFLQRDSRPRVVGRGDYGVIWRITSSESTPPGCGHIARHVSRGRFGRMRKLK